MNALENSRRRSKSSLELQDKYDTDFIKVERMLTQVEKWENDLPPSLIKQDLEEFKFGLESARQTLVSQIKSLKE
tara:strand:+ start:2314 stop:2538 length:225 start_codon:yes stop_codon:yes gene_type:complete